MPVKTCSRNLLTRSFFLCFFPLLFATNGKAQKKSTYPEVYVGAGVELAFPIGSISKDYSFGLGGSALLEVKPSSWVGLTLSLSYIKYEEHWGGRYNGSHIDHLAVLAGGRFYIGKYFFTSGQVGFGIQQDEYYELGGSPVIVPGFGFKYGKLDVTIKTMASYRSATDFLNVSTRIAFAL